MPDINNNISGFGYRIEPAGSKCGKEKNKLHDTAAPQEAARQEFMPDTGVIGRSQVHRLNAVSDIKTSADAAADMALHQPVRLNCSEKIYNTLYQEFLKEGLDEQTADLYASIGEEEFLEISSNMRR